jgi:hypothetical protein
MVLYNALSTLQAGYPNESITRSLSMFKFRGTVSGGTLASLNSVADLSPEERTNSEWSQTRKSPVTLPQRAGPSSPTQPCRDTVNASTR